MPWSFTLSGEGNSTLGVFFLEFRLSWLGSAGLGTAVTKPLITSRSPEVGGSTDMDLEILLRGALEEARLGLHQGGLPIVSVLADQRGRILGRGNTLEVQWGDTSEDRTVECVG